MALILDKKYTGKNNSYRLFITNRLLRIYPIYLIVLGVTLIFILFKYFLHLGSPDNAITHYFFYATQEHVSLWDEINFILRNLTLIVTSDYFNVSSKTGGFLLVQQAWTLQIELLFYLIVPFLLRIKRTLLTILTVLYIVIFFGFVFNQQFLGSNTLIYTFLSYLIFFLLGIGSYIIFKQLEKQQFSKKIGFYILGLLSLFIIFYQYLPFHLAANPLTLTNFIYYVIFSLSLPFVFLVSASNPLDRLLGQLSYPIYIVHFFFVKLFTNFKITNSFFLAVTVIISTLIASFLLVKFVDSPLDHLRQGRLKKQ